MCSIGSRGEYQKDAKRPSAEGLVRYCVTEGDCYCRGWLQLTEDHESSSTEEMQWVELLRTRRSIWPGSHKIFFTSEVWCRSIWPISNLKRNPRGAMKTWTVKLENRRKICSKIDLKRIWWIVIYVHALWRASVGGKQGEKQIGSFWSNPSYVYICNRYRECDMKW